MENEIHFQEIIDRLKNMSEEHALLLNEIRQDIIRLRKDVLRVEDKVDINKKEK